MKFKQLYESILDESQSKHDDLYLVLMLNFKLDLIRSCKIWEQCGKRSKFRHITDGAGLVNLINNKDKNLTISATKLGKIWKGIETDGTVVAIVEADFTIWWPRDAWTYIGQDSMRWMDINKAKKVTSNIGYAEHLNPIIPKKMVDEYYVALNNLLKKFPALNDIDIRESNNYMLISLDSLPSRPNEGVLNYWIKNNKKEADKIVKESLKLQFKFLDKYSDIIQKRLMQIYNDHKGRGRRDRMDEAVVNNIEVIEVVALDHDLLSSAISSMGSLATQDDWDGVNHLTASTAKDILQDTILGLVLYKTKYKGLFTVYSYYDGLEFMNIIAKKQYGAQYGAGVKYLEDELKVKYFKDKYFKIG